jgi:hypothetical protein
MVQCHILKIYTILLVRLQFFKIKLNKRDINN